MIPTAPKITGIMMGMFVGAFPGHPTADPIVLDTHAVTLSANTRIQDRFGRLRFLGMLELPDVTRNGERLSQLSGLGWDEDEDILYTLSDKGGLFHLRPKFDGDVLTGLKLLHAVSLQVPGSEKGRRRIRPDSEDLAVVNGRNKRRGDTELIISFERSPRIARYRTDGRHVADLELPAPLIQPKPYQDNNKMLESVCVDSRLGPITVPERPLHMDPPGYTRLFALSGKSWRYPVASGVRITSLECLNDGEVIILLQKYEHVFSRILVWLERVRLEPNSPDETLNPETLVTLDSQKGHRLDNFEGLARHRGNRFFMISDNNDLFFQRTLLMYFELLDE